MGSVLPVLALLFLSCLAPSLQQGDEESYPLTPPIASAEVVQQDNATCPSAEVFNLVKNTLQPLIQNATDIAVPCTPRVKGLVSHCPASNCTELFNLNHAQEAGIILLSNYYWLLAPTGEVRKVYCNRDTQQSEYYSSCEEVTEVYNLPSGNYTIQPTGGNPVTVFCNNETGEAEYFALSCADVHQFYPTLPSGNYTIRPSGGSPVTVYCDSETEETVYFSCADINEFHPDLPSGNYTIRPSGGSPVTVYCDMDSEECGGGVWTRVASYNYSDSSVLCPATWTQATTSLRGCTTGANGCASSYFSSPLAFNQVCGKVIGIQYRRPDAFRNPDDIESHYVEGVSITHGHPRQHIWTFAGYSFDTDTDVNMLCPCSNPSLNVLSPPSFVGNNYFCDTAVETHQEAVQHIWHLDDPLWDGQGCPSTSTCCSFNNPPWFSTTLPQSTTDDIEVRICGFSYDGSAAIIMLDLYVK